MATTNGYVIITVNKIRIAMDGHLITTLLCLQRSPWFGVAPSLRALEYEKKKLELAT